MLLEYDSEADAIYVSFRPIDDGEVARTKSLDSNRNVDYDSDGVAVGVEFLDVREGVRFDGLPRSEEIRELFAGLRVAAA